MKSPCPPRIAAGRLHPDPQQPRLHRLPDRQRPVRRPPGRAPLLAIVTAVKNDREALIRTHHSLRMQTCQEFAWIVADGGSTDGTAAYLAQHCSALARWWSAADAGPYAALNRALRGVGCPYVLFLNAGDRLPAADSLAAIAAVLQRCRPDFLYGDCLEDRPDGRPMLKPARAHSAAWYGMFTHHQAMIYRTALLPEPAFESAYAIGADYALTLRVLAKAHRIERLSGPLARVAPPGRSARYADLGRRDEALIRQRLLGWSPFATAALSLLQWLLFETRRRAPFLFRLVRCRIARTATNPMAPMENVAPSQRHVVADKKPRQLTFGI